MEPTTGTDLLDGLVDGVRIGDNLVLEGDHTAPLELLVDRFVARAAGHVPLVLINVAAPWVGPVPPGATVLDWSPVVSLDPSEREDALAPGAGTADALAPGAGFVDVLAPGASFVDALASLRAADERVGSGAAFVFDRLTAVQAAWGSDAALELFLTACPRLYRRRSLALWPVDIDQHRPTFLRRLAEITQVVIELTDDDGRLQLAVRKADGRSPAVIGRSLHAAVVDGDLCAIDAATTSRERLGAVIRGQRLRRSLSQVEVARRVGITPSALSQVERGVRGPSGDTLMRLWEVLGVPFGPPDDTDTSYRVARRSGRDRPELQDGLVAERLIADPAAGELWLLEIAPGATGDRPIFPVKSPESAIVIRGVLDVTLRGRTETLHEGDALVATDATITGWANPGRSSAEVVWAVHSGG